MNFIFKGECVDYTFANNKKPAVLFLHGWGGNKFSFKETIKLLKSNYSILTITMPTTSPTTLSWTLADFRDLVCSILKLNQIEKVSIVCHSFGFRVACLLKYFVNINKLIVTAGAGPKKNGIFKKLKNQNNLILLKQTRFNFLYSKTASKDYISLNKTNQRTFVNIVNTNTINLLKFDCPVLLFWGNKDTDTKLWIAKKVYKNNNSKMVITNGNHFAYLTKSALFNNSSIKFMGEQNDMFI